jgi:hypothetical protein
MAGPETATQGFAQVLNRIDAAMRHSMAYDQGPEEDESRMSP